MNTPLSAPALRCPVCGGLRDTSMGTHCARCLLALALQPESDDALNSLAGSGADTVAESFPDRIGRYRLVEEIDRGGVGAVFRAWQADLKREVAVKMLLPSRAKMQDVVKRFRREAELMAGMDHPGILPVYEVGEHNGLAYFSMKLADGGNLAERATALRGRFRECAELVARIARAIGYAHGRGVLHRDLKPSNIVFDAAGQAMVTDFGMARSFAQDSSLTGVDALIGTPRYVAPEVVTTAGGQLSVAADVYGLGAILYELLSGQAPFADMTPLEVLRHNTTRRPRAPREFDAAVPKSLEMICLRCLEKRPQDRYLSADALADALEGWLVHEQPGLFSRIRLHFGLPSRRRRMAWAGALLISTVAAATSVWYVLREPIPVPDPVIATHTVAILPLDPRSASPAERDASRQLALHLRLPSGLNLLPFDATLKTAAAADFPRDDGDAGASLGAFLRVDVAAVPGAQRFTLRARDLLRDENLYESSFALADISQAADGLVQALAQRRRQAPPEARLSRPALASLLRAGRLLSPRGGSAPDLDAAIAQLKNAILLAPDSALAHARLAAAYAAHSGESFWMDSAIDEAARAERMDPTLGLAALQLGKAYYFKSWFARAAQAYDEARALGNTDADYWTALLYSQQGRFADSYRQYLEFQRFAPDQLWPRILIAHLLFAVGETDSGERALRSVIVQETDPKSQAMKEAEIAMYRGDAARCRTLAESLEPERYDGIFTVSGILRNCAVQQGDFAAALASAEASARAYATEKGSPNGNHPALTQAILLAQLHRRAEVPALLKQARQGLQAAIDSRSEYPPVWLRMAAAQRLAGETDAAYATLERAFALGLTFDDSHRWSLEFLPFQGDPRFAALRARSQARVVAERQKILAQGLDLAKL